MAEAWLRSRRSSVPEIPPPIHSDHKVIEWFTTVVLPAQKTWVIDHGDVAVALLVLEPDGWIDQL